MSPQGYRCSGKSKQRIALAWIVAESSRSAPSRRCFPSEDWCVIGAPTLAPKVGAFACALEKDGKAPAHIARFANWLPNGVALFALRYDYLSAEKWARVMVKRTLWLLALSAHLGSATLVHAASATCSEELKACRDRCAGAHKFTGAKLTSCIEQACPGAWGICMHSGYWTITSTNKKIGPLQKK